MQRQRRRDTRPELAVRRLLHADGFRYRLGTTVPGMRRRTIDITFPSVKVAVFVDGCFWHGCPVHATWPVANAVWWAEKLNGNRERDRMTAETLQDLGWEVLRFWEHEDPRAVTDVIEKVVAGRRADGGIVGTRP
jgi:DNA mismatch endonuclease (patch repair protein)